MFRTCCTVIFVLLVTLTASAQDGESRFEGLLSQPVDKIDNMTLFAPVFMPYNAVIIEIGSNEGEGISNFVKNYPYGHVYSFEPRPDAQKVLRNRFKDYHNFTPVVLAVSDRNGIGKLFLSKDKTQSSLLKSYRENENQTLTVCCVVLDDWCKENGIDYIDFLRIDANGMEFQILEASPEIVSTASVIILKTHFNQTRHSVVPYRITRSYLESMGFEMLSHWYKENHEGEAMFIRKEIYDSIFR